MEFDQSYEEADLSPRGGRESMMASASP